VWTGNFRDLGAAVRRMATLSSSGRITVPLVEEEVQRLRLAWRSTEATTGGSGRDPLDGLLDPEQRDRLDLFDLEQLRAVVRVCRESRTLSDAGRRLFAVSRTKRTVRNDADRLRKYLARFDLSWAEVHGVVEP
jgi:transcriptional regulatory protein RtcR